MNTKMLWISIGVIVIVMMGTWLYNSQQSQMPASVASEKQTKSTDQPIDTSVHVPSVDTTSTTQDVKEFTVTGKKFSFTPSNITVKKGDRVKITFKNIEGFHDFKIDEFGVATKQIGEKLQDMIEFTADKTGSFEYYCSVGQHRAMGMKGTLTIQ